MDDCALNPARPPAQATTRTVTLPAAMTIQQREEIKEVLAQAMAEEHDLRLEGQGVTEVDLVGLQMICATHRSAIAQGKRVFLVWSGNRVLAQLVEAVGLSLGSCGVRDSGHPCVWAGAGE